jgi:hypothetical protein
MKIKKRGLTLLVVSLVVLGLIACSGNSNSRLVGKWSGGKYKNTLEFTKTQVIYNDGQMKADYKIENGSIWVSILGTTMKWADSFEFTDDDTLEMKGDFDYNGIYKRAK